MTLSAVVVDDEPLARRRVAALVSGNANLTLAGECDNGRAALDVIAELRPDVVFLDIEMPELDGFEVVEALSDEQLPVIVFITAFDAHAVRAFDVAAVDYLLKPVSQPRFDAAIERVVQRVGQGTTRAATAIRAVSGEAMRAADAPITRFVARRGNKHYFVQIDAVEWIEGAENYVRVCTATDSHLVRGTMKEVVRRLDVTRFARIHRSVIVAIDQIASIELRAGGEFLVTLKRGKRFVSSRSYGSRVRQLIR